MSRSRILILFSVLVACLSVRASAVEWTTLQEASRSKRPALIYVGGPAKCAPCKRSQKAFSDKAVSGLMGARVCVQVPFKRAKEFGAKANMLLFVSANWKLERRVACPTTPEGMIDLLRGGTAKTKRPSQ